MTELITSIISLIGSITAIILAFYVSSQGLKDKIKRSYFFAALSSGLWLLVYSVWLWQSEHDIAVLILRFVMVFAIFTYPTLLHFVFNFLNYKNKFITHTIYLSAIILSFFCIFTNLFMSGVSSKLNYEFWPNRGGVIFDIYVLMWIIVIFISLYLFLSAYLKEKNPFQKARLRFVLVGITLGYIGGATNFFLWYDISIPPLGNILIPVYFFIIAYSIVKHRLMDIKLVMRKSFVYTASVISILIPTILIKLVLRQDITDWSNLIILVLAISIFPAIRDRYYKIANKYFFSSLYDTKEVITEMTEKLRGTLSLEQIYQSTYETMSSAFHTKAFGILTHNSKQDTYYIKFNEGFEINGNKRFEGNPVLHKIFTEESVIVVEELKQQ